MDWALLVPGDSLCDSSREGADLTFQRILTPTDLANRVIPNTSTEDETLEFKEALPAARKVAVRIAAFSNSLGGFLVFGVEEIEDAGIKKAGSIVGLDSYEAALQTVTNAVASRCRPEPDVEYSPALRLHADDQPVLVANVSPITSGVVAAHVGEEAWRYPYRTAHGTSYFPIDEVTRRMLSGTARRSFILLSERFSADDGTFRSGPCGIAGGFTVRRNRTVDQWFDIPNKPAELHRLAPELVELEVAGSRIVVPLSYVDEVWTSFTGEHCIALRCRIRHVKAIGGGPGVTPAPPQLWLEPPN